MTSSFQIQGSARGKVQLPNGDVALAIQYGDCIDPSDDSGLINAVVVHVELDFNADDDRYRVAPGDRVRISGRIQGLAVYLPGEGSREAESVDGIVAGAWIHPLNMRSRLIAESIVVQAGPGTTEIPDFN